MKSLLSHAVQKASELMSCCIEYISKLGKLVFKSLAASKCRRSISSVAAILRLGGGYLVLVPRPTSTRSQAGNLSRSRVVT